MSANPKQEASGNGRHKHENQMVPELKQFYEALGYFNATIIARAIENPDKVNLRKLIGDLVAECPDHDAGCGAGFRYDHVRALCYPEPIPDNG